MLDSKLQGAEVMYTEGFAYTQLAVTDVVDELEVGVVHGPAGVGKTFAVQYAMGEQDLPVAYTTADRRTSTKDITRQILTAVTGFEHDGTRYAMREELIRVLAETPRLIVVDEAQSLGYEGIEHMRFLHDDPRTTFALMLVGGPNCWTILSRYPQLRSRVFRRQEMRPFTDREVLEVIPAYHEIWRDVDPELLLMADEFARGHFREWRNLTRTVVKTIARLGVDEVDEDLIVMCTQQLGGVREPA